MAEPRSLPDRLDDALAALWAGRSDPLDRLVGGGSGNAPPISQVIEASATAVQRAVAPPRQIGGFEILGEFGHGGMGVVFRARELALDRDVALKVIRGGDFTEEHRVRLFQREVQTLARLRHPNIATLYGTGQTDDGRHYFVMEPIAGVPFSDYVSEVTARAAADATTAPHLVRVFCKVCDAIAYAHQKGVIHRDIKPSNILVCAGAPLAEAGSSRELPEVKVLDFGLARVIDPQAATVTLDDSRLKGTVPYMSPEQIVGDPEEVDVRADVYSLGVVLYQTLVGRLPFDPRKRSIAEMLSAICEETAPRPAGVNPWLRGDLETIILKAIERDPSRRYQSAASLADDLRRFLARQPIQARPAGFAYLAYKLVARHKLAFAVAAVVLIVSLAAGAISAASLLSARAAQRTADQERTVAESVRRFLADTFSHIDPRLARSRDTTLLRELLEGAVRRTQTELAEQPQVRARLGGVFGNAYVSLGLYDRAEPHLVEALALCEQVYGLDHPETFAAMNDLGTLRGDQGRLDEARRLHEAALEGRRRALGTEHRDTAMSINNLGELLRQRDQLSDADTLLQEAVDLRRRLLGSEHPETLVSMNNLAGVWVHRNKTRQAETLLRTCLAGQLKHLTDEHLDVLVTKNDLAIVLRRNGKAEEAEALAREVVEGFGRQLGEGHMDTLIARYNLIVAEGKHSTVDQSAEAVRRLLETAEAHLPAGHHLVGSFRSTYARRLFDAGRFAEAEGEAVRALQELESALGRSHASTRATVDTVADIYEALNQPDRAADYRRVLDEE